ncbi:MAG: prepilin-type N-terminal cleavage/methylation domain-containing protein [Myxococcales bacterium]|nr:prepilin-type N-terminal cleavage/methylation domain-containing protein [Myxococcota bacterium]MDW8281645.1 prepilin-type N-terminal cleavage/methylation domain-containing protein [Myxococcales bacterium]
MSRRGFTLLEVMVAMAILAGALLGLTLSVSRSVAASHHARLMTQATFLCRQLLVQLEDQFIVDGFTDDALVREDKGEFDDPAFRRFRWTRTIEKIRLPSVDQIQSAATRAIEASQQISTQAPRPGERSSPLSPAALSGMLGPVKEMLEQGIRRVTVRVLWDEPGRPDQAVEVVAFYTDMRRIPIP